MANPKAKKPRREFSTEYKRRMVAEANACGRHGEIAALLRREGLASSVLKGWRRVLGPGTEETLPRSAPGSGSPPPTLPVSPVPPKSRGRRSKADAPLAKAPAAKRRSPRGTGTWVSVPTTFEGQGSAADLERDIARWRRMIELAEQIIEGQRALREIEAELGAP